MKGIDLQKKNLEAIFRSAYFAPIFKPNPKYCKNEFADVTPYISYKDVVKNKFLIKGSPIGSRNGADLGIRDIIVEYSNIDDLVNDGWQLD